VRRREEKGVKVRLELGPKDADRSTCVLARAGTPGQVAQKTKVKVSDLPAAVQAALGGEPVRAAP
jgi:hypothetical protein